uniref:Folylpolyglutamate synthase (Trinotate prediction) n=1 Tax=Henneguya salminicola TaxID=69463 RepID=A0A6G3MFE9_HENSL
MDLKPVSLGMKSKSMKNSSSPHLIEARERIRINGTPLSYKQFHQYFFDVFGKQISTEMTYFVALTIMAFHVFLKEKVDVVVLETGIGGRFDTTNIIPNTSLCVITLIDYDHMNILGSSLEEISWNKAGIIKNHSKVITIQQNETVLNILDQESRDKSAKLKIIDLHENDGKIFR